MPAVIGRYPAPPGAPTVCLYAHHDVQPEGDPATWLTEPFVATERGERLHGRGTADDKGGFAVHLAALRAFDGHPPVGVTVLVEGEEEIGSPSLERLLAQEHDALAADVFVIADSVNWDVGTPAFTTSLRGLADCVVTVSTLDHAVHSGSFGGPVPDALTTLCRLLATLHDEHGDVAVDGLARRRGGGPGLPRGPAAGRGRPAGRRGLDRHRDPRRTALVQAVHRRHRAHHDPGRTRRRTPWSRPRRPRSASGSRPATTPTPPSATSNATCASTCPGVRTSASTRATRVSPR